MNGPCVNTDRELWREREGDYYADSIHVTQESGIGIDCGGKVFVMALRDWHDLASGAIIPATAPVQPTEPPQCVKDLLAIMNRDGGHYLAEHGLEAACKRAEEYWHAIRAHPPLQPTFCSQCGQDWGAPACGPTHAVIAAERNPCNRMHIEFTQEAIDNLNASDE